MQMYPFAPNGNTVAASVTATSQTWTVTPSGDRKIPQQIQFQNTGSKIAYFAFNVAATVPAAGSPSGNTPGNGVPLQPGAILVYTVQGGDHTQGALVSLICGGSDSTTVMMTPGEGA